MFNSCGPDRDLHSFPTRRSSDLTDFEELTGIELEEGPYETAAGFVMANLGHVPSVRSEEHTSELQSPDHLVCRLLLEKKNKELGALSQSRALVGPATTQATQPDA